MGVDSRTAVVNVEQDDQSKNALVTRASYRQTAKCYPPQSSAELADTSHEQLLLEHLPEVYFIARRIHLRLPKYIPFDDLVQSGVVGLIEAIRRYDTRKSAQLKHYASFRIRGAILDSLRRADWAPRTVRRRARKVEEAIAACKTRLGHEPTEADIAAELGMSLASFQSIRTELNMLNIAALDTYENGVVPEGEASAAASDELNPHEKVVRSELVGLLEEALSDLPERDSQLIALYYFQELTMKEVAAALGVGESRVSQIHAGILSRLRARLHSTS